MVVHWSAGTKIEAMYLKGEASIAGTITFQAVMTLCGARLEDTFFLPLWQWLHDFRWSDIESRKAGRVSD